MRIEFPYCKKKSLYYPLVDIVLNNNKRSLKVKALIDSGASFSVFRPEIAQYLGVKIRQGKSFYIEGISGRILAYLHQIPVQVGVKKFRCKIAFSNELTISFNLLGRDNFFQQFLVVFDEKHQQTILEF